MDKNIYYSTGKLSKLSNVTKDTLFHYDKIGLLCPEIRLDNGYRYYTMAQVEILEIIKVLRYLKMSVKEIKDYMDNRSVENLNKLINKQTDTIENEIEKLIIYKKLLLQKKKELAEIENINVIDVRRENLPQEQILKSMKVTSDDNMHITAVISLLLQSCEQQNLNYNVSISGIRHKNDVINKIFNRYLYMYVFSLTETQNDMCVMRDGGEYLVTYHKGSFDTIQQGYDKLVIYSQENNLEIDDYFYEDMITDALAEKSADDYIIRLIVKIK